MKLRDWLSALLVLTAAANAGAADEAMTLFDRGALTRAAALCEQRLAANPADAIAGAVLSRVRSEQGRVDEAIKLATAAAAADPKNPDVLYAVAEANGRKAGAVSILKAGGYAGKLRKSAEAALAVDPNHVNSTSILIDFFRRAPGFMGGDKKKAAELTEKLTQLDPVVGWIRQANFALEKEDSVLAGKCFAHAHEAAPQSGRAAVQLASWLAPRWRDPARAEKLALQVSEAEPWRVGSWQVLAALYAFQERWTELESVLERSEAVDATHLAPWYQAGRQLVVNAKDPTRAERYLRHYLSREPEIGAPSHATARWRLGLALEQQGRKSEATGELAAAVKLDPKLEAAKKDLKRVKG